MHNDMMNCKTVNAWLKMAQDDEVLVDPDDINHEAITNMWSFSPTDEETPQIHAADIVEFIGQVIAARSLARRCCCIAGTMRNAASYGSAWCRARMGGCRFAARCAKRRIYL
jgi:hypothetical protein